MTTDEQQWQLIDVFNSPNRRYWPEPYGHDCCLIIGEIEARIAVNKSHVRWEVYPEPWRPPDSDGTIYGRQIAATGHIDCAPTVEGRSAAIERAKECCVKAIEMLRQGMSVDDVWRETGSAAYWTKQLEG